MRKVGLLLRTPAGEEVTCVCCDTEKPITVAMHCHPDRDKQVRSGGPVRVLDDEPIFRVSAVARAKDHCLELGCTTSDHDDTYAFAHRDDLTIHLAK